MLSDVSLWSVFSALVGFATWAVNKWRKRELAALQLPDGSPSIDESVTRPMLELAQTCAKICERIYGRAESLAQTLEIDGWRCDTVIHSAGLTAVCGIVYRDDLPIPAAIVVWRGTNLTNRATIRANSRARLVPFSVKLPGIRVPRTISTAPMPGLVHEGLENLFSEIDLDVMTAIYRHLHAGRKVYVTGHSQGGGLASLTVAAMRRLAWQEANSDCAAAGLITFGSMRPGDEKFARYVTGSLTCDTESGDFGVMRYRNNNDIVPLVPLLSAGYRHIGDELYIWPCGVVTKDPCLTLKLVQQLKPMAEGIYYDGVADHSMSNYVRLLGAVKILE